MNNDRRTFLKQSGLVGAGMLGASLSGFASMIDAAKNHRQQFNMSGYCAPPLETVRTGYIGVGSRGTSAVRRANFIEGLKVNALCDVRPEKLEAAKQLLTPSRHQPEIYTGHQEEWKKLCDREDIDLVYIATPWHLHVPMAVYAMEQGKHVAVEVPAAITAEECWQLVETSEKTRKHCMMLENCCYDFFELLTLNMARQGFFGEIIHGESAYIHGLLGSQFARDKYYDMWRLKQNMSRNGNLYPTHGLGPVCQVMNINRGDKMDYLVSVSSKDFMMNNVAGELAAEDTYYKQYVDKPYRGNMNTTIIHTAKGRTIMVQHDVTSPRPYSRIHLISGTKGIARKWPLPARIAVGHGEWLPDEEMKAIEEQYTPEIVKKVGEMAKQVGGHGGMDFMMDWRLIDCLRNGLPLDQDVYDAATWSVVGPLSEWSVANRSGSIDVPDFTSGAWKTNQPVSLTLEGGGTTGVLAADQTH
ncbi:Gfo/Idh/MocA family protein [Parapedobacter tibetensis]|uniref:Gfo/Idh/MocA family protein n=1 Tax=Parapedobacter tibetensis TaxID=2972951 RepID=UPI00214DC9E8|nr:Gfo/Idh/MocA family oxidoreductase [Parapedobacter tibetensis]